MPRKRIKTTPASMDRPKESGRFSAVRNLLRGDVILFGARVPRAGLTGVLGVIFMYIATAGIASTSTPWWPGRGDSPRHIDYAWRVYNGEIPTYKEGLKYPVFNELRRSEGTYRRQPAASHPPLFYAIHAPVVGPILAQGKWERAIAAGRALNILLGVLCILALAWAAWLVAPEKSKPFLAVGVPALGGLTYHFTALNLNYANDVLLVLFATLAFIASYKILQKGLVRKYLIWLALLSSAGMATKASYIVILGISLCAVVLAGYIHGKNKKLKRACLGMLIAGGIFAFVLLTIGWFYYTQNYRVTGNWARAFPKGLESAGRPVKTLHDVLVDSNLWDILYKNLTVYQPLSIVISAFGLIGGFAVYKSIRRLNFSDKGSLAYAGIWALMLLALSGIFASQIVHAVGKGGYYFRYLLPVILPIALLLAHGLLYPKRLKGQLVSLAALAMAATSIFVRPSPVLSLNDIAQRLIHPSSTFGSVYSLNQANGISNIVTTSLLCLVFVGFVVLATSLFELYSRPASTSR